MTVIMRSWSCCIRGTNPRGYVLPTGVANYGLIQERFQEMRKEARKAAYLPADGGGVLAHAAASLMTMVTFTRASAEQPVGDLKGNSADLPDKTDKILARADFYLGQGDLEKVYREGVKTVSCCPSRVCSDV